MSPAAEQCGNSSRVQSGTGRVIVKSVRLVSCHAVTFAEASFFVKHPCAFGIGVRDSTRFLALSYTLDFFFFDSEGFDAILRQRGLLCYYRCYGGLGTPHPSFISSLTCALSLFAGLVVICSSPS